MVKELFYPGTISAADKKGTGYHDERCLSVSHHPSGKWA
jgi:hypothetical protein